MLVKIRTVRQRGMRVDPSFFSSHTTQPLQVPIYPFGWLVLHLVPAYPDRENVLVLEELHTVMAPPFGSYCNEEAVQAH